ATPAAEGAAQAPGNLRRSGRCPVNNLRIERPRIHPIQTVDVHCHERPAVLLPGRMALDAASRAETVRDDVLVEAVFRRRTVCGQPECRCRNKGQHRPQPPAARAVAGDGAIHIRRDLKGDGTALATAGIGLVRHGEPPRVNRLQRHSATDAVMRKFIFRSVSAVVFQQLPAYLLPLSPEKAPAWNRSSSRYAARASTTSRMSTWTSPATGWW